MSHAQNIDGDDDAELREIRELYESRLLIDAKEEEEHKHQQQHEIYSGSGNQSSPIQPPKLSHIQTEDDVSVLSHEEEVNELNDNMMNDEDAEDYEFTLTSQLLQDGVDITSPLSPRTAYIDGCVRERLNPRASLIVRNKLTKQMNLQHLGMLSFYHICHISSYNIYNHVSYIAT